MRGRRRQFASGDVKERAREGMSISARVRASVRARDEARKSSRLRACDERPGAGRPRIVAGSLGCSAAGGKMDNGLRRRFPAAIR